MLDIILAALLVVVLPARAVWRSRRADKPAATRSTGYVHTIGTVAALLLLLGVDYAVSGRSAVALGLGVPTTMPALVGVIIAIVLLVGFAIAVRLQPMSPAVEAKGALLLPQTRGELALFALFAIAVGFGWEVLYRGFLLDYLVPHIGMVAAVVVAASAYGLAHGLKSVKMFLGSLASAFAFTIGYALTGNLWWLILLHTGLPLVATLSRKSADQPPHLPVNSAA